MRNILIPCLGFWVFELELVNVANVKISSSNVASFQLGIGIGIGNISTMATFTSVGVGERNWGFENLMRNTVVCLTL